MASLYIAAMIVGSKMLLVVDAVNEDVNVVGGSELMLRYRSL